MAQPREHHHHHHFSDASSEKKLWFSVLLNFSITAAEIVGGIFSHSLALLSDALHNLTDTSSMLVSLFAIRVSRREKTATFSYGFKRAQILAALLNSLVLFSIGVYLLVEAVRKAFHPAQIRPEIMLAVALVGLAGNLVTALLLFSDARHSLNIRSTFLHIVSDTLSSVAIIIGGFFIWKFHTFWLDPLLTAGISVYILFQSFQVVKQSVSILMQAVPGHVSLSEVEQAIGVLEFVENVHHVHLWTTDGKDAFLECHVKVVQGVPCQDSARLLRSINQELEKRGVGHATIQLEFGDCPDIPPEHRKHTE
ncbi:MAG TPA: cation diffusion facilitator family transporter [Thermotogota bacterium]|nr:cation diffusion facilitator family transporter [Thermotogota bacterium]HRW93369.1 cation diffusion facilitator family transporter [Thermotogota bacterium]